MFRSTGEVHFLYIIHLFPFVTWTKNGYKLSSSKYCMTGNKCSYAMLVNCGISCRNDRRTAEPEFPIPRFYQLFRIGCKFQVIKILPFLEEYLNSAVRLRWHNARTHTRTQTICHRSGGERRSPAPSRIGSWRTRLFMKGFYLNLWDEKITQVVDWNIGWVRSFFFVRDTTRERKFFLY